MKKKQVKTEKKLSLDKFKVAEFKNMRTIVGGNVDDDKGGTITPPTNSGQVSN
ncbi:hypothetical protein [Flavobacterium sp. LHD-85]|uniref:hypothetical protein n=1 Tax=Flavobacterium sp. LHD-85 TaxID=3071410 RepID=UPI0027E09271|nr:hypothetical protein [Flavobacterium sp. LHD-85]MDQ6531240.1 hypothetical protein [Flavobacterium sp. LHD-85]